MYKIPTILTPQEIMDKAFKRAGKVQVTEKSKSQRHKKIAQAKVKSASNTMSRTLGRFVKSFPSFDNIPIFYYELFDVTIGIDAMKKSLGAVDWSRKTIEDIALEVKNNIAHSKSKNETIDLLASAYGRFSSVLRRIADDLALLNDARTQLLKAPVIDSEKPTIVFAGAPNVGKSLLVRKISSAKPKIAAYPFTTKGISVGHFETHHITYQVIDTPGLLDREMEKRNEMEQKAILALRYLANIIVFVMDPSEYCGYKMESQLAILSEIKSRFSNIPILEVENKVDLVRLDTNRQKISALEGEGVFELKDILVSRLKDI